MYRVKVRDNRLYIVTDEEETFLFEGEVNAEALMFLLEYYLNDTLQEEVELAKAMEKDAANVTE